MEFRFNGLIQFRGIVSNPVKAYVDLSNDVALILRKVKSYYICIIVMCQELAVNLQEAFISAKYIIDVVQFPSFLFKQAGNKLFKGSSVG